MTRLLSITLAALVLAAAPQGPARAQTAGARRARPTSAQKAAVIRHFEAGEAAKARRDYLTAASEYLAGYAEFPRPTLLYNTGEVYRLAGDAARALEYFKKYLAADPDGPGAPSARLAIKELSAALAAQQAEIVRTIEGAIEELADTPSPEPDEPVVVETPVVLPPPDPGRRLRRAGIITSAASVVPFALSVGFAMHSKNLSDAREKLSEDDPGIGDYDRRGEAANRNAYIGAGLGIAALGTGITLYILGRRAGLETPPVALTPAVTPSSFALGASLRF
jgi:tetratricopeptide (TPR) repeat protein